VSATHALDLATIRIDGGTQPREAISETTVREYADYFDAGMIFPPIDVFFDGTTYWLADGFHRYHAAKRVERLALTATVHLGTKRDAVLFSVAANVGHGLQRTNADKRKAASTLLQDGEWSQWSNHEIARRCGISDDLVGVVRKSLSVNDSEKPARTYTTKHGTEATMQTAKIGKKARSGGVVESQKAAYAAKKAGEPVRTHGCCEG
jgi:hypothetical protein